MSRFVFTYDPENARPTRVEMKGCIRVPAVLRGAAGPVDVCGERPDKPGEGGTLSVSASTHLDEGVTRFTFTWRAEFPDDPFLEGGPQGTFVTMGPNGPTRAWPLDLILREVRSAVVLLSNTTGDCAFWEAFDRLQPAEAFEGEVAVLAGDDPPDRFQVAYEHVGRIHRSPRGPDQLRTPAEATIAAALRGEPALSDFLMVRAEEARLALHWRRWILDLITALEVRAYEAFSRRLARQPGREVHFSPKKYFTKVEPLGVATPFEQVHPAAYPLICQAWGMRHEVSHNGRLLVREYDPVEKDADARRTRQFAADDSARFRDAVWTAFQWLGAL